MLKALGDQACRLLAERGSGGGVPYFGNSGVLARPLRVAQQDALQGHQGALQQLLPYHLRPAARVQNRALAVLAQQLHRLLGRHQAHSAGAGTAAAQDSHLVPCWAHGGGATRPARLPSLADVSF